MKESEEKVLSLAELSPEVRKDDAVVTTLSLEVAVVIMGQSYPVVPEAVNICFCLKALGLSLVCF